MNPDPLEGELDSDAWMLKGCSDGDTQFSSSYLGGDYARGSSSGNVTIGGLYSFITTESNVALGWQSTTSDLSPGSIILKVKNQSGFTIERIAISYRTWILNDQNRSQQFEFLYSTDNISFIPIPLSTINSDLISGNSPSWVDSLFFFNLNLPGIDNDEYFYLQWKVQDLNGSGSRDEWAIDEISLQITNNTCIYEGFSSIDSTQSLQSNEGFTLIGVDSYYDSPSNYGSHSPSARFDDDQDRIITTSVSNPFSLKFWMKALGNSSGSSLLIEGFDGVSWVVIENYNSLPGTGSIYSINNLSAFTQFRFTYSKVNGNLAIDDISISCGSCNLATETLSPTGQINFSSIYCNQVDISWPLQAAEYYLVLATEKTSILNSPQDQYSYQSNNSMEAGEQIEDSVFVVYNGASTQFSLYQLKSGTDYLIKIFPYNGLACEENYATNSLSALFTTPNCTNCPYLLSALINPCNEECNDQEGFNELLFFNSASFSFAADTSEFKIFYKGQSDNLLNQNMLTNPSLISSLNNLSDCSTLFIDATTLTSIPINSIILLCNNSICLNDIDKSILCFTPLVYVLSCESSYWNPNGEFLNSGYNPQQFTLDFSDVSASCLLNYSYVPNDIPQVDGSFVQFSPEGGASTNHSVEANCNSNLTPLPLLWGDIYLTSTNEGILLQWNTLSESDNLGFTIERSADAEIFKDVGWLASQGNAAMGFEYSFLDKEDIYGTLYYRLKQTDINGQSTTSITKVIGIIENIHISQLNDFLKIIGVNDKEIRINIYSTSSQLILSTNRSIQDDFIYLELSQLKSGIYIIQLIGANTAFSKKFLWH